MARRKSFTRLPELKDSQAQASRPDAQVWLSASAGAGKTQVLTARVLRLLLNGAAPEAILCLTFTKAGAAEMADRVHERLGAWVTLSEQELRHELFALGEPHLGDRLGEARQLFAKVLDARGGGLRIQTIHSFAQTLLAAFPAEADLPIGFRPLEGRDETNLQAEALADLVSRAEREGRMGTIDRLQFLAKVIGEDATRRILGRCAQVPDEMERLGNGDIEGVVRRLLTGGIGDIEGWLQARCGDVVAPIDRLTFVRDANARWLTKAGTPAVAGEKAAKALASWLQADVTERVEQLDRLQDVWLTGKGEIRANMPAEAGYLQAIESLNEWVSSLLQMKAFGRIAPKIAAALTLGQEYARAYADAKRAAGVVDFNDMIRATVRLLDTPGIGEWIRFKLDQTVDHVLVDEAQDTNAAQWSIVKALTEEFFAGEGAKGDKVRTVFAVGDFKQAIFGFQGTDPRQFGAAGDYFRTHIEAAEQEFNPLSISQSFRSSQPILDVVDAVVTDIGHGVMGLPEAAERHQSARGGSGHVELLPVVVQVEEDDASDAGADDEEDWFSNAERDWARTLASKVKDWTNGGLYLDNQSRPCEPGDIMILLRSRKDMARLIVSRLYEEKVPVAGVDRLRLDAPIAVQDLMAAVRFVLQPADDLSLASLLVSPLIGWTQDELMQRAIGRKGALWPHLRATQPREALEALHILLDMADRTTPYVFLENILSGPIGGRARLIARLGEEARDPVEELLNAALTFEVSNTPSLQLFLNWFSRGEVEIKRDPSKPANAVRVMTVHGSKGLQAPVVVLADATSDPANRKARDLDWLAEDGLTLPLFRPKKDELAGSLKTSAKAQDDREREEHWRLLYVALTRAEEYLFVGGALNRPQSKKFEKDGEISADCWHARVAAGMRRLAGVQQEAGSLIFAHREKKSGKGKARDDEGEHWREALPGWSLAPAPEEARPARPLAPSALGAADMAASPPPDPALRAAAERGRLLHGLFERLPAVRPDDRAKAARRWLEGQGVADTQSLVDTALAVLDDPAFAQVFSGNALAEAPLAGVVDGQVVAGTVDRLLVTESEVTVIDFKTGRRVPRDAQAVPDYHKAQMGAYAAVLAEIFPMRTVRAALLYSAGPRLITLSAEDIARWRPGQSGE
jgi:ATP-dependent helicase/nuclease subunit A